MNKIYERLEDVHVNARKVYAKSSDACAYIDEKCTVKATADDLSEAFRRGLIVVDSGVEYLAISCKVTSGTATVTYVTTDSSAATTAKLATVKSA